MSPSSSSLRGRDCERQAIRPEPVEAALYYVVAESLDFEVRRDFSEFQKRAHHSFRILGCKGTHGAGNMPAFGFSKFTHEAEVDDADVRTRVIQQFQAADAIRGIGSVEPDTLTASLPGICFFSVNRCSRIASAL
jgi:hypothetical protein